MKSIEERLMDTHNADVRNKALREIFDAYTDPGMASLVNVLSSIQKTYGPDWMAHVVGVMYGMETHDAAQFPDDWLDELEDDSLEAYNNARMKQQS